MIGEIRDQQAMDTAIAYAQSAHLCLTTLCANNSYQALNRILSFYPIEVRHTLLGNLSSALKSIVSQRSVMSISGTLLPAVEVLLNTTLVSEMIEKGYFTGVKEAMENSMTKGSQTFEEDLERIIVNGQIDHKEGFDNGDFQTNLLWRLQNYTERPNTNYPQDYENDSLGEDDSFTDISLDITPSQFDLSGFGNKFQSTTGFRESSVGASRILS